MKVRIDVNIDIPEVPDYFVATDGKMVNIELLSDSELRALASEWANALVKKAQERRTADNPEYKSARKSIMECEHAESCDKCRPLNTTDKYHGIKPCEAEFQKQVDYFLKRNTVIATKDSA